MFLDFVKAGLLSEETLVQKLEKLGKPQEDFLYINIDDFKKSTTRKEMLVAQDYYVGKHDIFNKKRYYIDREGTQREDEKLANNKLVHPYFTKLVNQKVNYVLSKEFTMQVDEDDKKAVDFREACKDYFDKAFFRRLKTIGKHAIINGIAWMQIYYDRLGKLSFKRIPSEEVIPFWADAEHTILEGLIRFYNITEYKQNGEKEDITKVEYYTIEGVWYYEIRDGKLKLDKEVVTTEQPAKGHFQTKTKNDKGEEVIEQRTWNKIPFVAFKYNDEEISLLNYVKTLIDDYDNRTSDTSDLIQDVPNAIRVIKGYGGGDKGEFSQNLATYRNIFVDENGGVDQLVSEADTTCTEAHLSRVKDDIYEAGNGVNIQKEALSATSGVALKLRYADLDADCMAMANSFAASIEEICWFIQMDLTANVSEEEFEETKFDILFNADGIINETDVILNCKNSLGVISNETIVANHPWTTDLDKELERIEAQREEEQELMEEAMNDGFGTTKPSASINQNSTRNKTITGAKKGE